MSRVTEWMPFPRNVVEGVCLAVILLAAAGAVIGCTVLLVWQF